MFTTLNSFMVRRFHKRSYFQLPNYETCIFSHFGTEDLGGFKPSSVHVLSIFLLGWGMLKFGHMDFSVMRLQQRNNGQRRRFFCLRKLSTLFYWTFSNIALFETEFLSLACLSFLQKQKANATRCNHKINRRCIDYEKTFMVYWLRCFDL